MSGRIRLGWSQRDITPHRPVALRGQFNLRIATRVQDPLMLTALALEADGDQAVVASMDFCTADDVVLQGARSALADRLPGFDPRKLIVSGTHTHTAPFASMDGGLQREEDYLEAIRARYPDYMAAPEYCALLTEALVAAVCEAWEKRAEGYLGWGCSHAVVGENRRVRYFGDRAVMYGSTATDDFSHIEGHVDHSVNLLCTYDGDRRLTGVLMNIACPSQASESGQDYVSADFWHDVRQELRRRRGDGLFVLPQCSAAGDQSPHRQIAARAEERMLALKYGPPVGRPLNAALRRDIALRLANALDDAEPALCQDLRGEVALRHVSRTLDLPHWNLSEKEYAALQEEICEVSRQLAAMSDADPLGSERTAAQCRIAWCRRAASRYEHPPAGIPAEVNVMRLGDIAFVTAPFEFYLDYGDRIKGRSPALQTFIVQLSGGGGYLATERAAEGLSYGAIPASCEVAPAGGQVIVEETLKTLAGMFAQT